MTAESKSSVYLKYFPEWLAWAEESWTDIDGEIGYFGTGTGATLAHSALTGYMAACAIMATCPDEQMRKKCSLSQELMIERALKSYRFIIKCHLSQNSSATDNTKWGHHWGSPIVIERMANFVDILKPYMPNEDLRLWHNMLIDEANYHLETSVQTNRFSSEGETHAERNYWRGSTLFRVAQEISNHKNVPLWLEKSSEFCVNALSVPDDAYCNVVVDGKPVNGRFIGANAHPEFVFEHHGAISIDYSIHTESFFTMIMISVLRNNWQPSDALSHHMGDVWNFVRQCILPSGNIAFIGGLQRPRYAITQSYLLPCLLFWHHYGCDSGAKKLAEQVLTIISHLRDESKDGSFYSTRAVALRMKRNIHPLSYFYYRLESDVIISLGLSHMIMELPEKEALFGPTVGKITCDEKHLQRPVHAKDAGLVFQRTTDGLFSVNWRRSERAEADPPLANAVALSNGHRAEWLSNLSTVFKPFRPERRLLNYWITYFKNGFATAGGIHEASFLRSDETGPGYGIDQRLAFILMPDGRTFLRLEKAKARCKLNISEIASLNLNIANDIFTGNQFELVTSHGTKTIHGVGGKDSIEPIESAWVNIADELGVVSLYGPEEFTLETFSERQRGYKTLLVERLYYPLIKKDITMQEGEDILDTAILLIANSSADETKRISANLDFHRIPNDDSDIEIIEFCYAEDKRALVVVNFSESKKEISFANFGKKSADLELVTPGTLIEKKSTVKLVPWEISIFMVL